MNPQFLLFLSLLTLSQACSSSKEEDPTPSGPVVKGTLVLQSLPQTMQDGTRLKPQVSFDIANTPGVDYQATYTNYADFPANGITVPFSYQGETTLTLTVTVGKVTGQSQSHSPFFTSEVNVNSKFQGGVDIRPIEVHQGKTVYTYTLATKDVK